MYVTQILVAFQLNCFVLIFGIVFFFTRLLRSNESDVGVSVFWALASELA